jgi:twitching motility protein PilT
VPTGSGKTTTLATMVNYINENLDHHIVTIEDPIEYYHSHKKSLINQRAVGTDVPSFAEALRRVLRQDPDVIMVGELRDLETIEAAVRAAETGHLVFSTVHTTSAAGTITRLIDVFPPNQQEQIRTQLASNLLAVLSQALCPLAVGRGRVAAYEFMVVTPAIANLIRENKVYRIDSSIQTGKKLGMQLLDEHLWQLYDSGKINQQEMLDKARQPGMLKDKADAKLKMSRGKKKGEDEEAGPILRT